MADVLLSNMINRDDVINVLKTVYDPEIYLDLWTLGLIYDVEIIDNNINIRMTFTSVACPVGPALVDEVKTKVSGISGVGNVNVEVVFNPPWQPSEELMALLGLV
ncbi:MAG: DUF59 domain-containing protein [Deltaproteobacteria bacterium]|nr:DUF59 domain-containing protein [Deltaproteobacteria bacterium]